MQYETYKATSGEDTSRIHFQITPPIGGCTLKGDSLIMKLPLSVIITKGDGGNWATASTPFNKNNYGLAQFPFARVMEELTVLINGKHELKYAPSVYHHALKSYTKLDDPKIQQEMPMPDIFSTFRGYTGSSGPTVNHPLYAHGSTAGFISRATHYYRYADYLDVNGNQTGTPTPTSRSEFVVMMPIPMKIFRNDIHNIMSIDVTCKLMSYENLVYLFNTDLNLQGALNNAKFDFRFKAGYNPVPSCQALWSIPSDNVYYPVQRYRNKRYEYISVPSKGVISDTNGSQSVRTDVFTFGRARRMYIYTQLNPYATPSTVTASQRTNLTSTFGVLTYLRLMVNAQTFFSGYDEHMLWQWCARKGYYHSFVNARGGVSGINGYSTGAGTVLRIDFPEDIKITDSNTVSADIAYMMTADRACYHNLYLVFEYDEEIEI